MNYIEVFDSLLKIDSSSEIKPRMLDEGVSPKSVDKHLEKMAKVFLASLYESYTFGNVSLVSMFIDNFSLSRMKRTMGRVRAGDRIAHLYSYFSRVNRINIWERGYNLGYKKKLSTIGLYVDMETMPVSAYVEAYESVYGKANPYEGELEYELVWVNRKSLYEYSNDLKNSWEKRIDAYKLYREADETGMLKQYISETDSPRKFYKGRINLQLVSSEIRKVALARPDKKIVSYDIEAGIVNWKLKMARDMGMDIEKDIPSILGYARHKNEVREMVCDKFDLTMKQTKSLLSALSHGASLSVNPYRAIHQITHDMRKTVRISCNQYFRDYKRETDRIVNGLLTHYDNDVLYNKLGRNKSKMMAYLYQEEETRLIEKAIKEFDIHDAFTVHDCIYTNNDQLMERLNEFIKKEWTEYAGFAA